MLRELKLILGPPGTGKTTTLINKVKEHLEQGTAPGRIAFVSFTKKAATEAADRARSVLNLPRKDLINFRTLHSLAFQSLGIRRGEVMGRNDYLEIASLLGVEFRGYADMSDGVYCATEGDMMLHMVGLAHAKVQELRDVWEYINPDFDWFKLKQFNDTIEQYKQDTAKIDFNDMIKQYTSQRLLCEVDVAIIDEAQDLSNAQWDMVKVAFRGAKHIYLAGDDDQAIYEWSGANIERFLGLSTDREVLPLTYRLPKQIMEVTESIAARIKNRFEKSYRSMNPGPGAVYHVNSVDMVKITQGSWFLLARNAMHLSDYKQLCHEQGVGFTDKRGTSVDMDHLKAIKAWVRLQQGEEITEAMHALIHMLTKSKEILTSLEWYDALKGISARDREYYQSILRAGNRLDDCGRVYIGTIHCSPPDELILTTCGYKPISLLDPQVDRLISLNPNCNNLTRGRNDKSGHGAGYKFHITNKKYDGRILTFKTKHSITRVTPTHRMRIKLNKSFMNKWAVYIMRRGDWWRAGICTTARIPYVSGGVAGRLASEKADDGWIIHVAETREEALMQELIIQGKYGIPSVTFESTDQRSLTTKQLHETYNKVKECVEPRVIELFLDYGIYVDAPMYTRGEAAKIRSGYWCETIAANAAILTGRFDMPVISTEDCSSKRSPVTANCEVSDSRYTGNVYSLEVLPFHYYVSGGAVVHNSVKGGEADHVVLKQDVTWNTARGFDANPDAEHRVFYVGASRARQSLHIVAPQGEEAYII